MIEIKDKTKCCGCSACYNICPKNAITMMEDEKGFKYPVIDKGKCINCGLCEKICPILNEKQKEENKIEAYACINKNIEDRLNSSSGGIFILLAKEIIKMNGVVFGACFDEQFNVKHTYSEKEEDLKQFMGSKYVQSNIGDSYKKVKEFLDKDRYVLFTGTPCQIEGLKSYLKKDYDKLYTQDLICHGVPSPKVWGKYLDYQKQKSGENIRNISFRNKEHSWSLFRMKITFDTKTYSENLRNDIYMKSFLSDINLRDSCYSCSFKKKYRNSDITLADYWGIDGISPNMNDEKGTSLFIIHSSKGRELFDKIKSNLKYESTDLDYALKSNPAMIKSAKKCKNSDKFIENIDKMEFDNLVNKYIPKDNLIKKVIRKVKYIIKKLLGLNK